MIIQDLDLLPYNDAWAAQERAHQEVLDGGEERVLLVEHPPVITLGRRAEAQRNIVADAAQLMRLGVEVVHSDRGGDVTFHGPGQIVAYPIIRLNDHGLSVGGYVRRLQQAVIQTLGVFGIEARLDPAAVGVWVDDCGKSAKICALGVRIRRGVSMHGIALNVETDLRYFNLIVPCGLPDRQVTSIRRILGAHAPSLAAVKQVLTSRIVEGFRA